MSHANLVYKGLNQAFKTHNYNIWVISLSEHLTATFFFFFMFLQGGIWSIVDSEANTWKPVDTPSPALRLSHNGFAITLYKNQSVTIYL